jgi:beta-glucosidase
VFKTRCCNFENYLLKNQIGFIGLTNIRYWTGMKHIMRRFGFGFSLIALGVTHVTPLSARPRGPELQARSKQILVNQGTRFKDLNANGRLDPYEDWRLPVSQRVDDLVARMTLPEKAGMLLIATNNPGCGGGITPEGRALIETEHMTRFILRSSVVNVPADCNVRLEGFAARRGYGQTPEQMASYTNAIQEAREATRLGIPALFKDNARNHVETNPLFGISQGAGAFTEFPKEAGLAAAALGAGSPPNANGTIPANLRGDMAVITRFTRVMGQEWRAIGMRGMYGYMADLTTEPRWSRAHETFSEDATLVSDIMGTLVSGLQGPVQSGGLALSAQTSVALTLKHFPGGGPQQMGWDPHYSFGKNQFYTDPSGRYGFGYHLKPFQAAITSGVSSVMPYYGVPIGAVYNGRRFDEVGMAFSPQIIDQLLRKDLGFKGYVNSDSGIIEERGWGLEGNRINPATGAGFTVADRTASSIKVGTDILSEFRKNKTITDLVASGQLDERRNIDPAVRRLLMEQFSFGLFENPYVDAGAARAAIGTPANRTLGFDTQRQSVVLLKNSGILPLKRGANVYNLGFDQAALTARGFNVTQGGSGAARARVPAGTDVVLIKIMIDNSGASTYASNDPATGGRIVDPSFGLIDPITGKAQVTWGDQDPCVYAPYSEGKATDCIDNALRFGGAFPWESGMLALSDIATAKSWRMTPSLADIQGAMSEIGDPSRVVISVYFRNPYVLDEASGVLRAGGLLATFGVSDAAQLDVIAGRVRPRGRLPFALPKTVRSVAQQYPDAPGYGETTDGALFPFGFGLSWN